MADEEYEQPADDAYELDEEPELDTVMDKRRRLESYWGTLHALQEYWHRLFMLELQVSVPDGYKVVYPGTGNDVVEVLADHVAGEGALLKVPVPTTHITAQRRSEHLEKWLQAAMARFQAEDLGDPVRSIVVDLAWAGMCVSQLLFDPGVWGKDPMTKASSMSKEKLDEALDEYNADKKQNWPFVWRTIDPRYVYADPGTHGKEYVIVSYMRNVGEIAAQWRNWSRKGPGMDTPYNDTDEVEWTEFWNRKWKMYIAAGEVVEKTEHRYKKPPFRIKSSGLGKQSGKPHEQYRSILAAAGNMIEQEVYVACQLDAVMRNAAWTSMMTPIGSSFKKLMPGKTIRMKPEDIELTKAVTEIKPEVVTALMTEFQWVDQKIQGSTYPNVVKGMKVSDVGYTTNSLAALARIRFGAPQNAAQLIIAGSMTDLLQCVEDVVEETVPVYGQTKKGFVDISLSPKQVAGTRYVTCKLNPKLPVDRANEVQIGTMLREQGAIDQDTFIEDFAGYEQPEEMRIRVMRDRIMAMPFIDSILQLAAAEEMGMLDWLQEKMEAMGLPPQALMGQLLGMLQLGAPAGSGAPTGAPGNATNGAGGGTPDTTMFPTAQTQPAPGAYTPASARQNGAGLPSR